MTDMNRPLWQVALILGLVMTGVFGTLGLLAAGNPTPLVGCALGTLIIPPLAWLAER